MIEALPRGRLPVTPEYLSADQVAQMTGFSPKWLEARRTARSGPPCIKIGLNFRSRTADLRAFMEAGEASVNRFLLSLNDHPDVRQIFARFQLTEVRTTYSVGSRKTVEEAGRGELVIANFSPG